MELKGDYNIFLEFIDAYLPRRFEGINREDPLMQKINSMMKKNRQYFYFGDMLKFKIIYTCSAVKKPAGAWDWTLSLITILCSVLNTPLLQ